RRRRQTAWYTAGCRRASRGARSARRRSGSIGPCAGGTRGTPVCRHTTDRGHAEAACRSSWGRPPRRLRSAFFSATLEGDDHGLRIAEEALDLGQRDKAGEAVEVVESLAFGHATIVTSLSSP